MNVATLNRRAMLVRRQMQLPDDECMSFPEFDTRRSMEGFAKIRPDDAGVYLEFFSRVWRFPSVRTCERPATGEGKLLFQRIEVPKGPLSVFGYDYFDDKFGMENARKVRLLNYRGLWGSGSDYAYEVLNFVDGKRTAQEIRDAVSAEFGPVPLELVVEYLRALEKIGVVKVKE